MNDETSPPTDDRVRVALRELADEARHEPTRTIEPNAAGRRTFEMGWRRGLMAAAVVALLAAAVTLVVRRSTDNVATDQSTSTTAPTEVSTGSWFVDLEPDSVAPLPDAPIAPRMGASSVWSGSELIIWGGADPGDGPIPPPLSDGAAFDPATGEWRVLPDAPIEGRAIAATVWTGTEMIVVGGSANAVGLNDGAAFDPATNDWRTLPEMPVRSAGRSAVWTGTEMIVIGGNVGSQGVAYDPVEDSWRELPFAPGSALNATVVWTGEAVLATLQAPGEEWQIRLAMYRPDVDEWEVVHDDFVSNSLIGAPGVDLGMVGEEVVALTDSPDVGNPVLSVFGDVGHELNPKPSDIMTVNTRNPIWSGHEILLWAGGDTGVAFDPLADEWREFPAGGIATRHSSAVVWADGVLLAWGGLTTSSEDGPGTAVADGIIYRPVDPPEPATPTTTPPIDTTAGCPDDHPGDWVPGDNHADYIDFVRIDGQTYEQVVGSNLTRDQLGDAVGDVCFTLGNMAFRVEPPSQDGDASYLPVGTTLRAIRGADAKLRIAAETAGGILVYEVTRVDDAEVGADLIDVSGEFAEVGIGNDFDGSQITAITDADTVNALIDALASAPADLSPRPESEREGERYLIELVRADGTTTTRTFWVETGELWPGIDLPPTWADAVEAALASSPPPESRPTPTTAPAEGEGARTETTVTAAPSRARAQQPRSAMQRSSGAERLEPHELPVAHVTMEVAAAVSRRMGYRSSVGAA